jgi:hypothetical protein
VYAAKQIALHAIATQIGRALLAERRMDHSGARRAPTPAKTGSTPESMRNHAEPIARRHALKRGASPRFGARATLANKRRGDFACTLHEISAKHGLELTREK